MTYNIMYHVAFIVSDVESARTCWCSE